jgi:hypothetical protein
MSAVPKDDLIDQKIAEIELEITRERAKVVALKASLSAKEWKNRRAAETKHLYNLFESRFLLNLIKSQPGIFYSAYAQVRITGVRSKSGKFYPAEKVRILDWAVISGDEVQGGDVKSESAIMKSVRGGLKKGPQVETIFRPKAEVRKQRANEAKLVRLAKRLDGYLVLSGRDPLTDSKVTFEVHWEKYRMALLNTYKLSPDELLGSGARAPASARPSGPAPKSQKSVSTVVAGATTASSGGGRKSGTVPSVPGRRSMDIFTVNENDRFIGIEAKSYLKEPPTNRMTTPQNRMAPGTRVAALSFGLGLLTSFIGEEAAARRFAKRMEEDGYVPVGAEYEVSSEYSRAWRVARLIVDPFIVEKMKLLPLCLRFDVNLWREGIRRRASQTKAWGSLLVRFPVVMRDGGSFGGASAVFEKWPDDDDGRKWYWYRASMSDLSGTLMEGRGIDLNKIIDPDIDDDWVLGYLHLREAMKACWESVEQYEREKFIEEHGSSA